MGNLADELDFADEDWDDEDDERDTREDLDQSYVTGGSESTRDYVSRRGDAYSTPLDERLQEPSQTDGARDSGVDIGYSPSPSPSVVKFSNGPFRRPPPTQSPKRLERPMNARSRQDPADPFEPFSLELEDALAAVAQLADPAYMQKADTMSRTIAALQDLGAQTSIETQSHRLTTSMNSLSANVILQTRLVASLSSSLVSPFTFTTPLDAIDVDEVLEVVVRLLQDLPLPDPRALQGLSKLDRDTTELLHTLSGLVDSLQMGKQTTASATRHLRVTQTMVTELKRERDKADESQFLLERGGWDSKLDKRWCAAECQDVVNGFEQFCDGLRRGIEESAVR